MLTKHRVDAGSGERRLTDDGLVEKTAQAVEVAARIRSTVSRSLLRAHVSRRSGAHSVRGHERVPAARRNPGDAEVAHHRVSLSKQDVLRLDVPVDHPAAMGVGQRVGDLGAQPKDVFQGKGSFGEESRPQRAAFNQGRDEVEVDTGCARIDQGKNVRVLETGFDLDFAQEPLRLPRVLRTGVEDLDGDPSAMLQVLGLENRAAHSPSDFLDEPVMTGQV